MKLYSGPLSLFSRKVEIVLGEKGLDVDRVLVPFTQRGGYSPRDPAVMAANPKGQVPVLVDGPLVLYDSTVIVEYLEDAYPQPPLYPRSAVDKARCRMTELLADEVVFPALWGLSHRTEPGPRDSLQWRDKEAKAAASEATLRVRMKDLDQTLETSQFLCGSSLTVADVAMFVVIFYVQRLAGPSTSAFPSLHAWFGRLCRRDAFARVAREIIDVDRMLSEPVPNAFAGHSVDSIK